MSTKAGWRGPNASIVRYIWPGFNQLSLTLMYPRVSEDSIGVSLFLAEMKINVVKFLLVFLWWWFSLRILNLKGKNNKKCTTIIVVGCCGSIQRAIFVVDTSPATGNVHRRSPPGASATTHECHHHSYTRHFITMNHPLRICNLLAVDNSLTKTWYTQTFPLRFPPIKITAFW